MSPTSWGILSLFGAASLYGSQNIASRIAGISYGPFLSTGVRSIVTILFLFWFVRWKPIARAHWKWFVLRAVGSIMATAGSYAAVNHMSVGAALFTFYAADILFSGLFGIVLYKEKITVVKMGSLALTAVGLYLINFAQSALTFNWYVIVALIGGIGASLWSVFSRPISKSYSLPQLVVTDQGLTLVGALLLSLIVRESWSVVQVNAQLGAIGFLGLTQVFTGQLVARGFMVVDAQVGSVILLNDTVVGMILAFFIFREIAPVTVILGGACIFLSSIIPAVAEHRKPHTKTK